MQSAITSNPSYPDPIVRKIIAKTERAVAKKNTDSDDAELTTGEL